MINPNIQKRVSMSDINFIVYITSAANNNNKRKLGSNLKTLGFFFIIDII